MSALGDEELVERCVEVLQRLMYPEALVLSHTVSARVDMQGQFSRDFFGPVPKFETSENALQVSEIITRGVDWTLGPQFQLPNALRIARIGLV